MVAQHQRKVVTKSVSERKSVENQIQELLSTVKEMQEMMQGMINQNSVDKAKGPSSVRDGRSEKAATGVKTEGLNRNDLNLNNSLSETTVYHEAVKQGFDVEIWDKLDPKIILKIKDPKQGSSSSKEEQIDTSDELIDVDVKNFIADCHTNATRMSEQHERTGLNKNQPKSNPRLDGDQMIKDAEVMRARMVATSGHAIINTLNNNSLPLMGFNVHQSALVDKKYVVIGGQEDETIRSKIVNHEYIDFARLLP